MNYLNENQSFNFFRPGGCIYKQGDLLIFCSRYFDGIFRWDLNEKKCFVVAVSNDEKNSWLYLNYLRVGRTLYFIPYKAKYMLSYHLDTQKVERILVRVRSLEVFYHKAAYYQEYIYLFPVSGEELLIYNLKEGTTDYCRLEVEKKNKSGHIISNIYHCDNKVWFVTENTRDLYCYHLDSGHCAEFVWGDPYGNMVDITGDSERMLFILMEKGTVVAWNIDSGEQRIILKENGKGTISYFKIHYSEGKLWLIPQEEDCVRVIDLRGNEICQWNFSKLRNINGRLFEDSVLEGKQITISTFLDGRVVLVDTEKCSMEIVHIELKARDFFHVLMDGGQCVYDNETRNNGTYIWEKSKKG